jgi:hypothetical protein
LFTGFDEPLPTIMPYTSRVTFTHTWTPYRDEFMVPYVMRFTYIIVIADSATTSGSAQHSSSG